jgi:hypothetical protein
MNIKESGGITEKGESHWDIRLPDYSRPVVKMFDECDFWLLVAWVSCVVFLFMILLGELL